MNECARLFRPASTMTHGVAAMLDKARNIVTYDAGLFDLRNPVDYGVLARLEDEYLMLTTTT